MPEKKTIERAKEDQREGKSSSTQAGEFVREEIHHVREGKHGARSAKQVIAIGLSKARRAGVKLPAPTKGKTSTEVRQRAQRDLREGQSAHKQKPSAKRSRAISNALQREGHSAASQINLARQAKSAARMRSAEARHRAGVKAVETKGKTGLEHAAGKGAQTRANRAA